MQIGTGRQAIYTSSVALLTIVLALSFTVAAQTIREKLTQPTDYRPRATEPDKQLVEVAQHFKIPMAIEWLDQQQAPGKVPELSFDKGSLLDLITAIVDRALQENLIVEDRIVRVFSPSAYNHELSFLNLKMKAFCVADESVLGASYSIKHGIDVMLYPEYFKHGFAGGYGGGERLLWIKDINICVDNATIRDLLTEIAAQSGKTAWIAHITPEELRGKEPFWKGVPMNNYGTSAITGHWQFFALVEYDR